MSHSPQNKQPTNPKTNKQNPKILLRRIKVGLGRVGKRGEGKNQGNKWGSCEKRKGKRARARDEFFSQKRARHRLFLIIFQELNRARVSFFSLAKMMILPAITLSRTRARMDTSLLFLPTFPNLPSSPLSNRTNIHAHSASAIVSSYCAFSQLLISSHHSYIVVFRAPS